MNFRDLQEMVIDIIDSTPIHDCRERYREALRKDIVRELTLANALDQLRYASQITKELTSVSI